MWNPESKSGIANEGASTKPGSDRLDRIGLRIGSVSGSDRTGFLLLVQKSYFEKSCFY